MKMTQLFKHLTLAVAILLVGASCFRTRSEIAEEQASKEMQSTLQKNLSEQSQSLEHIEEELGKIQGRMEELEFNKKKETGVAGKDNESLRQKMTETSEALEQIKKNQEMLFEEIKKIKEDVLNLSSQRPTEKAEKKSVNSAQLFEQGAKAFDGKDYDEAIKTLREYLAGKPKGKKAVDAQYYLGESLYRQKLYQEAILAFGAVHEKKDETKFGRKSTLRLAQSFAALGKKKDAATFAQLLLEESPTSEEAKQAKKYIR